MYTEPMLCAPNAFMAKVEQDESGNLFIPIPMKLLESYRWDLGDTISIGLGEDPFGHPMLFLSEVEEDRGSEYDF